MAVKSTHDLVVDEVLKGASSRGPKMNGFVFAMQRVCAGSLGCIARKKTCGAVIGAARRRLTHEGRAVERRLNKCHEKIML